jgi:hypothetical protein
MSNQPDITDVVDVPDETVWVSVIGVSDVLDTYVHTLELAVKTGPNLDYRFKIRRDEALLLARSIYDMLEEPPDEGSGPLSPWCEP